MGDSKAEMKVDEEIKPIKELCEKLVDVVKAETSKGIEQVDTKELGEAIDMIKDLAEAKEHTVKACYYKQIMGAMEDAEYGVDYDEDGVIKGYRYQPRDSMGRFKKTYTPPMYKDYNSMRDMDMRDGVMYYSEGYRDGNNRGYSDGMRDGRNTTMYSGSMRGYSDGMRNYDRVTEESRFDRAKRHYTESKGSNAEKAKDLEGFWNVIEEELNDKLPMMSAEEKTMLRTKVTKWMEHLK